MNYFRATFSIFILFGIFAILLSVKAQSTPEEHSQHHPQQQMSPSPTATPNNSNNSNSTMNGGMGKMMENAPTAPKELYPSLMQLPSDLPQEKRDEIKSLADERVSEGNLLISSGVKQAKKSVADKPYSKAVLPCKRHSRKTKTCKTRLLNGSNAK